MNIKNYNNEYQFYRNFWQNNLQKIEEITELIEKSLFKLEKKYTDFQSIYDELTDRIDLLSSIYSSYNSLLGGEYLLKLKAIMRDYRKRYTHDGINFNLIYYIHSKIIELRNRSFDEFPKLQHNKEYTSLKEKRDKTAEDAPYKWITFERNGSCFITPYSKTTIIDFEDIKNIHINNKEEMRIEVDDIISKVTDPLSISLKGKERPNHFLFVRFNNGEKCFAVKKIGKKILARKDILSLKIKPYKKQTGFRGYMRLFGRNHIYI